MRSRPALIAAAAASLGLAFVAGRLTAKPRVVEQVREVKVVEYREANAQATEGKRTITLDGPVKVVHRKFQCPDGKPSEETVTEKAPVRTETVTLTNTTTDVREHRTHDERVRIVPERDAWALGASVGMGLDGRRVVGVEVSRRVLGPLHLSLGVTTDRTATIGARWTW